jgi:hypothetical protein
MATPPSAPILNHAPLAGFPNTLEYTWQPPANQGSSPITGYRLTLNPGNLVYTVGNDIYYKVEGLANAFTYSTKIEATNDNGVTYGAPAFFIDFQTGSPPLQAPSTVTATATGLMGTSGALVSWTAPQTLPDATIFWYYITAVSSNAADPILSTNAWALSQSNVFITGFNDNSQYYFNVQAVNCPGYSPILSTNAITWLSPPFAPNMLTGLQTWHDAQDATTIIRTLSSVSQWNDKSGNQRNMIPGNTCTINYNISTPVGGYPGLNFSNFAQLTISSFVMSQTNQMSLFIVMNQTGLSPSGAGNADFFLANDFRTLDLVTNFPASTITLWRGNSQGTANVNITGRNTIVGMVANGTTTASLYLNTSTAVTITPTATFPLTSSIPYFIGGGKWQGNMCEIITYSNPVTPFNQQKIEGYLGWKWGIQSNLPTTHPFKTAAPLSNSVFSPSTISSLNMWYDATDSATVIRSLSSVTQWNDKSGRGNHMVRSGTSTINYDATAINTSPALSFSNYAGMSTITPLILAPTNQVTYFMVLDQTALQPPAINPNIFQNANDYRALLLFTRSLSSDVRLVAGNGTERATNVNITSTATTLLEFVVNGASAGSAVFINGTSAVSFTTAMTYPLSTASRYLLCGFGFVGSVGEILTYSSVLTTGDRQTVEGYLAWKWGIQGRLPLTHPYVLNNPAVVSTTVSVATTSLLTRFDATSYSGSGAWSNTGSLGSAYDAAVASGTPTKNPAGNGIVFDGTLYYTIPNIASMTTRFTLSFWVKRIASMTANVSALLSQDYIGGTNYQFYVPNANDTSIQVGHFASGTNYTTSATTLPLNTWTNYVATYDATSYRVYVNGALSITYTPGVNTANNGRNYWIGYLFNGNIMTGVEIGQILVYNRTLTATEALQNYAATSNTFSV